MWGQHTDSTLLLIGYRTLAGIRRILGSGDGDTPGEGLPFGADGLCAHLVDAVESMRKNKGVLGTVGVDLSYLPASIGCTPPPVLRLGEHI